MKKLVSIVLVLALSAACFAVLGGCTKSDILDCGNEVKPDRFLVNGEEARKYKGSTSDVLDLYFDTPTDINSLFLKERTGNVRELSVYDCTSGTDVLIYRQDYVIKEQFCAFEQVTATHLSVRVDKCDGDYNFTRVATMLNKTSADNFRVTAYVIADRLQSTEDVDDNHFATITDIILFGAAEFDKNGELTVNTAALAQAKALVDAAEVRLNKKYNVYLNFLFKDRDSYKGDWDSNMKAMAADIKNAIQNNADKLIGNLVAVATGYEGIAFDWEYPIKRSDFTAYGKFVTKLKEVSGKKLALALAPWGIKFWKKYIKQIDVVELMTYDLADEYGNHSNFYEQCIEAIAYAEKVGFKRSQIDLGLPFYARPSDMAGIWTDYSAEAAALGKYSDKAVGSFAGTDLPRYYNCYQTIMNKTAYAKTVGLGGVMIWHYSCDLPSDNSLSLFNAIKNGLNM